jgi:hypothetical protein
MTASAQRKAQGPHESDEHSGILWRLKLEVPRDLFNLHDDQSDVIMLRSLTLPL